MILTFFKGLLRELWLLVKDPRGIFMFLVAPLLMNIVVCGAFQNGIVNHIPLAAVEMSSSAKTRELIRAFDESDRFDVTLVLQDLDEAKQKMEEGEVYGIIVIPADYTRSLQPKCRSQTEPLYCFPRWLRFSVQWYHHSQP